MKIRLVLLIIICASFALFLLQKNHSVMPSHEIHIAYDLGIPQKAEIGMSKKIFLSGKKIIFQQDDNFEDIHDCFYDGIFAFIQFDNNNMLKKIDWNFIFTKERIGFNIKINLYVKNETFIFDNSTKLNDFRKKFGSMQFDNIKQKTQYIDSNAVESIALNLRDSSIILMKIKDGNDEDITYILGKNTKLIFIKNKISSIIIEK